MAKAGTATFDKVVSLANEGLTPIGIAEHLDIHKSKREPTPEEGPRSGFG